MKLNENTYTFVFALIVCMVCSFTLASVSEGLRPRKELNEAIDIKKNILKAVNLRDPLPADAQIDRINQVYEKKIEEIVVDSEGNVIEGKNPHEIAAGEGLYPLYVYKEGGRVISYCFPIVGKGLWSTLYGYLALESDAQTVRGITYYKHGETPGLGAEIEQDWFQNNFKGKKIWDVKASSLRPVAVVKGKVGDKIQEDYKKQFYVDGISGATMTSQGVTEMIDRELKKYEPYLKKHRSA